MKNRREIIAGLPKLGAENRWFAVSNNDYGATEIDIFDTIGLDWFTGTGLEASAFSKEWKKIPRGKEIKVYINSPGGIVADGLAIYNLIAERRQNVSIKVVGGAYSIASIIALAG